MSFKDPTKVWGVIDNMLQAGINRANNRVRINQVFNGNPPFTDEEARDNRIETNVNFLEGTRIIHSARQQFEGAFIKGDRYFTIDTDFPDPVRKITFNGVINKRAARLLKRSSRYTFALSNQIASTVLHGVGPVTWLKSGDWCPVARGTEEVLVPTNTLTSLENLAYFAIYTQFTAAQLHAMAFGSKDPAGWNQPLVKSIIQSLAEQQQFPGYGDMNWANQYMPEKIEEDFKQNAGWWGSDVVPVLKCYDFYFRDVQTGKWHRRIIADRYSAGGLVSVDGDITNQFLYDPKEKSYGEDVSQIMHVQFANGAVVPPFKWHSVRSLGYLLYSVCHLQNRLRCKFTDAMFEQMLWLFRVASDGDMEKIEKIDLYNCGVVPDGVSWVPQAERHTVDYATLSGGLNMMRQLMAESSASYTSDVDEGNSTKEMTATEIMAKVNSSNALMGSMLNTAYVQQEPQYREIVRRLATSNHPECVEFRRRCEADGVDPAVWSTVDDWDIIVERAMGSGNKMLQIAQSDRLLSIRALLNPQAQQVVLHQFVEANTDDARLAELLVPLDGAPPSPAVERATMAWGTLYSGQPVVIASELNRIEYAQTLLAMLASAVNQAKQMGRVPSAEKIAGLANVGTHIGEQIQYIAQDNADATVATVKLFQDALAKLFNEIKAFAQQRAEQDAAEAQAGGVDPELQKDIIAAQAKARIRELDAAQKRQQKEIAFRQDQSRKDAAVLGEAARAGARVQAEIAATDLRTAAEVARDAANTDEKPEN